MTLNAPVCNYAVEAFYDLGLRKGDILFYTGYLDHLNSVGTNDEFLYKRIEIGIPLMSIWQSIFIGNKGKEIYDEFYSTYNNTEPGLFACPYFDAAYLIGSALDWAINRGLDYENPAVFQKSIRDVKFIGCTGTVYIQKNTNDRSISSLSIRANTYSPNAGVTVYTVGYLKPSSSEFLTIIHPIVYSDGTTIKPPDFRGTNNNCPFDNKLKQTFYMGRALVFGICFIVAAITAIITFIIWKKWWNIKIEELKTPQEISIQDFIIGASIIIEFFQLLSMGPDIRPLNSFIADIGDLVSLDLESFLKLENGKFWWLSTSVIGLCGLWLFLCLIVLFRIDEKYEYISLFRVLGFLAEELMPILGNLCFIPFISTLLDIFVCDESIGNSFTKSFLSKDCYQFCWQGSHIIYVVLSIFALFCYEPLAVFCRPLWQELESNLHVKSLPLYLMSKTVIQVILVVMHKTLKRSNEIAHGCVFTVLIILYTGFIWKFKAYNYGRFNWWQQLSLIGVAWITLLSTACAIDGNSSFPYLPLILSGWFLIVVVGLIVQRKKYPSLLYRQKVKDTSTLFKFAFSFGKKSQVLHSKITPQKLNLYK
ncbi:unnamed protein product [Blepharisma stoltei]|uniref:Receptor ligand binding region domain-containing protein n=1 Tax=Blepharisma stoltei TaxID=1481888 RepID=A0AAU9IWX1_9CILI|nr:unnamed protein product [Blepharisma stoltei]